MANLIDPTEIMYTNFAPKLKNQFIVYAQGIPSYMVKKFTRPKNTSAVVTLPHINVERYMKGRTKWETVNMELYDPIVPSGAQIIMEWIRAGHESVTGRDGYPEFYQRDITLVGLGPVGDKIEEWTLKSAWVESTDFGEYDWGEEAGYHTINCVIRYNYAILQY